MISGLVPITIGRIDRLGSCGVGCLARYGTDGGIVRVIAKHSPIKRRCNCDVQNLGAMCSGRRFSSLTRELRKSRGGIVRWRVPQGLESNERI